MPATDIASSLRQVFGTLDAHGGFDLPKNRLDGLAPQFVFLFAPLSVNLRDIRGIRGGIAFVICFFYSALRPLWCGTFACDYAAPRPSTFGQLVFSLFRKSCHIFSQLLFRRKTGDGGRRDGGKI
jgi:hypothetical protein